MNSVAVAFLLLTKNEETTIEAIVRELKLHCEKYDIGLKKIVLADDSSDRTPELALALECDVVRGSGEGLGAAYQRGVKYCSDLEIDFLVTLDADGQTDLSEVSRFLRPLLDDEADLVTASRFLEESEIKYAYPALNRIGVNLLALYLTLATRQRFTDSHGGIRAMRREVARTLTLTGKWTYVQEAIVDANEKGFRIVELPSSWRPRKSGRSRVVGSIPHYARRVAPVLLRRLAGRWIHRLSSGRD